MRLSDIFTDNMILQQNKKIAIFGFGNGVGSVEFCEKKTEFKSKDDRFCVYLPPEKAGGPYDMTVTLDQEKIVLKNILIGDVFIAAGQSNMQMKLSEVVDIEKKTNFNIRFFTEPHDADRCMNTSYNQVGWQVCDDHISDFSAIGYGVAQLLSEKTDIPIGILSVNKGASRVDAWTAPEIVNTPEYEKMIVKKHQDYDVFGFNQDSWLYSNKLLPVVPFAVRGVLWYQGESNRCYDEGISYCKMFKTMVQNWRDLWNDNLPFYTVQLMPFDEDNKIADWAIIRKNQELAAKTIENVYLTTLVNTDEEKEIHPTKKSMVCKALANAILNTLYGEAIEYCGPVFESYQHIENGVRISFSHNNRLTVKNSRLLDVYAYDNENNVHSTSAEIKNNALEITWQSEVEVKRITMGYCNSPRHNLYNSEGFLASPFEITFDDESV